MAVYKHFVLVNKDTNITEKSPLLSYDELKKYLEENTHLTFPENKMSELGSPLLHSGMPMSVYKTDGAYREKLQGLKDFYPRNNINI